MGLWASFYDFVAAPRSSFAFVPLLVALLGLGVWLFVGKGCREEGAVSVTVAEGAADGRGQPANGAADAAVAGSRGAKKKEEVVMKDLPPRNAGASGAVGTTMLQVAFKAGVLTVLKREDIPEVEVRPMRAVEGMTGLYYRVVGEDGEVAFENIVADPRVLYWDTVSDEGRLAGGRLDNADQPVLVRLPFNAKGRLEVYLVARIGWSRKDLSKEARLVGVFRL